MCVALSSLLLKLGDKVGDAGRPECACEVRHAHSARQVV